MSIQVISRSEMQERLATDPHLVDKFKIISINDPGHTIICNNSDPNAYDPFIPDHPNVLSLVFHDADERDMLKNLDYCYFNELHAADIVNFLAKCLPTDDLIIHCFAGISRSGSVGTFAREFLDLDHNRFSRINPQIVPNTYVLRILRNYYYGDPYAEHRV